MKLKFIILILGITLAFYFSAPAQNTNPAEEIFGKNFQITVDPTSGTLKYNFSEKDKKLESIIAHKQVNLVSDNLSLKCDTFNFDAGTKKIVAVGKIVTIEQEGITAKCGKFIYNPNIKKTELFYSPEIIDTDKKGRTTKTHGDKITIEGQKSGATMVHVMGSANFVSKDSHGTNSSKSVSPLSPSQKMFGREFEIITGKNGEILYIITKDNTLQSIVAHNDVFVNSDQVDLSCDRLEFYSTTGKLLALGKPVKIFQKTLVSECGRFEYYPDEGKTLLLEDPVIINKDSNGRNMETRGDSITIIKKNGGKTTILVKGKPSITSDETKDVAADNRETKTDNHPVPIDESSVSKIKFLDISKD